eukprot:jgi/Botrbrau1/21819/Bobra.0190s0036.2
MAFTFRCRGPMGQVTLTGLDVNMSLAAFQEVIAEKCGVPAASQEILCGYPQKVLPLPENKEASTLGSLGLASGETLVVRGSLGAAATTTRTATNVPQPAQTSSQSSAPQPAVLQQKENLSRQEVLGRRGQPHADALPHQAGPRPRLGTLPTPAPAPPPSFTGEVALPGGAGVMTRRTIAADNSCLFNAVGYVMEHSLEQSQCLRRVIFDAVTSDPETYSEAFLGKDNAEYGEWIKDSSKWGGAIELSIFCKYYAREIAAYDIQTKRVDVYGQGEGYDERVMLIYDGLHYDALAIAAGPGAPPDADITIFDPRGPDAPAIMEAADKLVAEAHAAKAYTDMGNFTLRCTTCSKGLVGQEEAQKHAQETGHINFTEYSVYAA